MIDSILLRVFPELLMVFHGRSVLLTNRAGNIGDGLPGLYEHDLRLLSRYRLLVHGRVPQLAALSAVDAYSTLGYYVAPPTAEGGHDLGQNFSRQVAVRVARFVGQGLHEDVDVTNHGLDDAHLELAWELAADFADLAEPTGGRRQQEAPISVRWTGGAGGAAELHFDYHHPRLRRGTLVRFAGGGSGAPDLRWDGERVRCTLNLGPRESQHFCLTVAPIIDGEVKKPFFGCDAFGALGTADHLVQPTWIAGATRIEAANPTVQESWERAVADLGALALGEGATPEEFAVPAAGIPVFAALFGRDVLTAAVQSLVVSPALAEGALRRLAGLLGTKDDDFYDEQPGRVLAQMRDNPLALLGQAPWTRYYGDYAAPCDFLLLVGGHHLATGDAAFARELLEPAKRVLDWLDNRADLDGDGFIEYQTRSPKGPTHQGWKDSEDAVVGADGRQVEPPIAPCEIQGYCYVAKLLMAEVFLTLGEPSRAFELYRQAEDLKRRFNERFWLEDERFIAFGLDARKEQIRSIASNAGHCLATGIVDHRHATDVVRRLMAPDMFSGWGIRTLSSKNPAFNPFAYHLGSVWPVENATTAFGMKRYGFAAECNAVAKGIFDAAALFEHRRLPEVFGGQPRDARHPHPGIYPMACAPQAWSASAVFWLVQAMLGMWSYAPLHVLIVEPSLPDWLPEVTLRHLRIGDARVSLRFRRDSDGRTDYKVLERAGTIYVVRQPPPDDLRAGAGVRLRELVESLLPVH